MCLQLLFLMPLMCINGFANKQLGPFSPGATHWELGQYSFCYWTDAKCVVSYLYSFVSVCLFVRCSQPSCSPFCLFGTGVLIKEFARAVSGIGSR